MAGSLISMLGLCLVLLLPGTQCSSFSSLLESAKDIQPWLVSTRRELHQWPELLFDLQNTSKFIRGRLDELHIPYK